MQLLDTSIEATPSNVAPARHFVTNALRQWRAADDVVDDAVLLVSELVTNAVRYDGPRVALHLQLGEGVLRILVEDGTPPAAWIAPIEAARNNDAERGRGLLLVNALARDWGVQALASGGKNVWFELDVAK
jgi:anti-sigma regulatory factor (Ser/Thr protein kinase)